MSDKYTTARLAKGPDHFEILVKPEPALEYKLGKQIALIEPSSTHRGDLL